MIDTIKNICGFMMVFGFSMCYIPQIIKILRTKSVRDISLPTFFMTVVGYVGSMFYMLATEFQIWWFLNQLMGLGMCAWTIYLCLKYRSKD